MATATDPCSQHTRASRRGGQIQTANSQLIQANGLPNPRLPEPLSRNPADATPTTGRDAKLIGEVSSPYNLERMLKALIRRGGEVACCGTCLDVRGISAERLLEGARRSSMEELADWTLWAERVVAL